MAAPLSPSKGSSARSLRAAGLLPGPLPDLETGFSHQVHGGCRGGGSPRGAPTTQPPVPCAGGGVPLVHQRLVLAEVTRIGDILDYNPGDWLDPLTLVQLMGISRPCTPHHILQEVRATLLSTAQVFLTWVL
ncbi:unnamed protein product [Eretmochelys imbricata]